MKIQLTAAAFEELRSKLAEADAYHFETTDGDLGLRDVVVEKPRSDRWMEIRRAANQSRTSKEKLRSMVYECLDGINRLTKRSGT